MPAVRLGGHSVHRIALEASGGYEAAALAWLHAEGFSVVLVEPLRARRFARPVVRAELESAVADLSRRRRSRSSDPCPSSAILTLPEPLLRARNPRSSKHGCSVVEAAVDEALAA